MSAGVSQGEPSYETLRLCKQMRSCRLLADKVLAGFGVQDLQQVRISGSAQQLDRFGTLMA